MIRATTTTQRKSSLLVFIIATVLCFEDKHLFVFARGVGGGGGSRTSFATSRTSSGVRTGGSNTVPRTSTKTTAGSYAGTTGSSFTGSTGLRRTVGSGSGGPQVSTGIVIVGPGVASGSMTVTSTGDAATTSTSTNSESSSEFSSSSSTASTTNGNNNNLATYPGSFPDTPVGANLHSDSSRIGNINNIDNHGWAHSSVRSEETDSSSGISVAFVVLIILLVLGGLIALISIVACCFCCHSPAPSSGGDKLSGTEQHPVPVVQAVAIEAPTEATVKPDDVEAAAAPNATPAEPDIDLQHPL